MKRIAFALACLTAAHAAQAEILDINIGSDSFRAALSGQLSRMFDVDKGQYDFGLLSKRRDSDDLYQGHFGVLLTGDAGASNADVSAGLETLGQYALYDLVTHERTQAAVVVKVEHSSFKLLNTSNEEVRSRRWGAWPTDDSLMTR